MREFMVVETVTFVNHLVVLAESPKDAERQAHDSNRIVQRTIGETRTEYVAVDTHGVTTTGPVA